jgi:hypothetical protein
MPAWAEIVDAVQRRAGFRCEYCQMHQALQGATFHVEHAIPRSLDGATELENLALACPSCNLHKSDRTQVRDSETATVVPFFNPRKESWDEHFCWNSYAMEGRTPTGRATIEASQLNSERHVLIRQAEEFFKLFPPGSACC